MRRIFASAAAAALFSTAALADGTGVVTEMVSAGPAFPYAELFYTNGQNAAQGGHAYCFLTSDPGYDGELRSESMSYATRNYAANQEQLYFVAEASTSLCPPNSTRVDRLQLGQ